MRKPKLSIRFNNSYRFLFIPEFYKRDLLWKDKWNTPRCEHPPHFRFDWLWFSIYGHWEDDQYWEQWLWIHKYNDGDEEKAMKNWPWIQDVNKPLTTWIDY